MNIEHYALKHQFLYIAVKDVRELRSDTLPFAGIGKMLVVKLPPTIYSEVREICKQEVFDYLLMSTKEGISFDSTNLHWTASDDAFAWFAKRNEEATKTRLPVIETPRTPAPF